MVCNNCVIICRGFKQDCPDGQLGKDKILEMYSMILPAGNAKVFVDQIFRIFDKDGNGSIDFKVNIFIISRYIAINGIFLFNDFWTHHKPNTPLQKCAKLIFNIGTYTNSGRCAQWASCNCGLPVR